MVNDHQGKLSVKNLPVLVWKVSASKSVCAVRSLSSLLYLFDTSAAVHKLLLYTNQFSIAITFSLPFISKVLFCTYYK
jgi:hypothetical protein